MLVRALDATSGELLEVWSGQAHFLGPLPACYLARRAGGAWEWKSGEAPAPEAARLKIDSDRHGRTGSTLAQWAPRAATSMTVDLVPLIASFGSTSGPLPGGERSPLVAREADGNAPIRPEASAALEGPQAPGTYRAWGPLAILDEAAGSTISLGTSVLRLCGRPGQFHYRLPPQTSPRQRIVQVTATHDVAVEAHAAGAEAVELVLQLQRATAQELAASQDTAGLLRLPAPEISARGDGWRVTLRLGESALHIAALAAEARFAYFVDPDWRGTERLVHVVATPGVRIQVLPNEGSRPLGDLRTLVANPIYVQDPRQVPRQGEPIEPSRYLGIARYDHLPVGITATEQNRAAFSVATGGTGLAFRDLESGATLTIRAADPTLGARYRHEVEGKQVRALVSKAARVEIVQARQAAIFRGEAPDPLFDFGQIDFQIFQLDREDYFPAAETPLTLDVLGCYGHPKRPDAVHWAAAPEKSAAQQSLEGLLDLGLSFVPGADLVLDASDAAMALTLGTDKWGNPLSRGEKIAVFVALLLPLLSAGAVLAAKRAGAAMSAMSAGRTVRALRAAEAVSATAALAQRMGRTHEEVEALLAGLRALDDEARHAARRIERAVAMGEAVAAADLQHLERSLRSAGFRTPAFSLGPAGGLAAPVDGVPIATSATEATERIARPSPTTPLVERQRLLQQALHRHANTIGARRAVRGARVEVLPARDFRARFGSEQARATFQLTDRGPVIFARADATAADMLDEAAHLAQLRDAAFAPSIRLLDEANLADWASFSVADKLELFQHKLELELDAKRRVLRASASQADQALSRAALHDLEELQAQVAAIEPDELVRLCSGQLPPPDYLAQPPRLHSKLRRVREEVPSLHVRGEAGVIEPREVSQAAGSPDYSPAYGQPEVRSVHQVGHSWTDRTWILADLDGAVISRTVTASGAIEIVVGHGKRQRMHLLEAGADVDAHVVPGRKIAKGERLGRDPGREYRAVEVGYADGSKQPRSEIRSWAPGRSWVLRGTEANERGRLAEAAARAAADADLAQRTAIGEISSSFRLSSSTGRGGFDDVIVEFSGEGEHMKALLRIREVKDHAHRHVALGEFSALLENFETNYTELIGATEKKLRLAKKGQSHDMTPEQLANLLTSLKVRSYRVEIVLGASTKLGAEGHHASRVLPTLTRRHSNIFITRIKP